MSKDGWWRPEAFAVRRDTLRARSAILKATRAYFDGLGFEEVETPALQVAPGMEVHLQAFETRLLAPGGSGVGGDIRYLHTSPEFAMKKLLAAGVERPYQIARVFRNAEGSDLHSPEFSMLEWYRADAGYRDLIADCEGVLRAAVAAVPQGDGLLRRGEATCDPAEPVDVVSVADLFVRDCGIDVLATAPDPLRPDAGLLRAAAFDIGIHTDAEDSWEDIFFRIFLDRIEPTLGIGRPTVVVDYPISMAALARPKPDDPRLAERFELFVCGVELANSFGELTDPEEQRRRYLADQDRKQMLYGARWPVDEDFIAAVGAMPDAAGIALGFDRLVMLATGADKIDDVLWAPVV